MLHESSKQGRGGVAALCLLTGLTACATGGSNDVSKPLLQFPASDALSRIEAQPVPTLSLPSLRAPGSGWTLAGPFPERIGDDEAAPGDDVQAALWRAAREKGAHQVTGSLSCAAREIGRFFEAHQAQPEEGLQRFMTGACGVTASGVRVFSVWGQVAPKARDEQIIEAWKDNLGKQIAQLGDDARTVGLWFTRQGTKASLYGVAGRADVQVTPFSRAPAAEGDVAFEGQLTTQVEFLSAYINQGRAGFSPCLIDASVKLPRFRVSCPMEPTDPAAWIQLVGTPPGRALGQPVLEVLARREDSALAVYDESTWIEDRSAANAPAFTSAVVELLNKARQAEGLRPVTLSGPESETASRLAPHYFASSLGHGDPTQADTIALGLLAGWQVGGLIRDGSLVSFMTPSLDAGRWLRNALGTPMGRVTLLAPGTETVAIGAVLLDKPKLAAAVVTGYRFQHQDDPRADLGRLYKRVVFSRRAKNQQVPSRLAGMDEAIAEELAEVRRGRRTPMEALDSVLSRGVGNFGASMRGYVLEVPSLDAMQFPPAVLSQEKLHMAMGLTYHRPPGGAWAQLVVLIVYIDYEGETVTASADARVPRRFAGANVLTSGNEKRRPPAGPPRL